MTDSEKMEAIENAEQQIREILISLEAKVEEIVDRVTIDGDELTVSIYLA